MAAFAQRHSILPVTLLPLDSLRPHEEILEDRVERIMRELEEKGVQERPILVDAKTMIILDGHHRTEALRRLGARRIAAVLVDYDSDLVTVGSWRPEIRVTKDLVRHAGLTGRLLPPRTSRHRVNTKIPRADTSLEELRR
ncbi:MAG: ParB N-terminal domain-containing protein [Desulfurococcales archaeon]|nr:ParB N-terminal domain-containing protein [Desulfurococcales archaeon]